MEYFLIMDNKLQGHVKRGCGMEKLRAPVLVAKPFLPPLDEYTDIIREIWQTNHLTNNGPIHSRLEEQLKDYLLVSHVSLFCNGHLSLEIAIKALRLSGEAITTPFTFASTTHAIVNNNLRPVFCDIETETFNIDAAKIEELITDQTCAIIPVHVFGSPCDVDAIETIACKYNLKVIYDAAHAFGVTVKGKGIGNFGDISMFSLHATKNFHSIEGGALSYNNAGLKHFLDIIKNFGISSPETVEEIGLNAKMNEFQAAMGLLNLRYVDALIQNRKNIVEYYRSNLSEVKGLRFLSDKESVKHNYAYFPIVIDKEVYPLTRDDLHSKLQKAGIFARKYFYPLTTDFACYKNKYSRMNLSKAKLISDSVLILPLYSDMDLCTAERICEVISNIS
jgi:dTDP-4-amino-4,6-dideoxygalactose transaminase